MSQKKRSTTHAVHAGHDPYAHYGLVNPPTYRGSTVLFPTLEEFEPRFDKPRERKTMTYGLHGNPTTFAMEDALCELEGGDGAILTSSGLSAITIALLTYVQPGDHILVTDSVYYPTRSFCNHVLKKLGITTTFYDPEIGANIETLIQSNTRLIFLESPGSLTFEIQDTPAICEVAKRQGIVTLLDNTWGTPLYHHPLELGVDASIHALTKYVGGHADLLMGAIIAHAQHCDRIRETADLFGERAAPDEIYLALRGLRSLPARMPHQQRQGIQLAKWLQQRPEVERVIHPALPSHPNHELWKRDFTGSASLFGMELKPVSKSAVAKMVDGLTLFRIGASWGGFESLIITAYPEKFRTAPAWKNTGPLLRLHVGLEDLEDLKADLDAGFSRLHEVEQT